MKSLEIAGKIKSHSLIDVQNAIFCFAFGLTLSECVAQWNAKLPIECDPLVESQVAHLWGDLKILLADESLRKEIRDEYNAFFAMHDSRMSKH